MTTEQEMMVCFAQKTLNPDHTDRIENGLKSSCLDWKTLLDGLIKNKLAPLCHYHLNESFYNYLRLVPDEVKNLLFLKYEECVLSNFYNFKTLEKLLGIFGKNNIDMLIVKGPALIAQVYQHVGIRPLGDIDVLVSPNDLNTIDKELKANGFTTDLIDLSTQKRIEIPEVYTFGWQLRNHYHLTSYLLNQYISHDELYDEGKEFVRSFNLDFDNSRINTWKVLRKWPARTWVEVHHSLVSPSSSYDFETESLLKVRRQISISNGVQIPTLPPEEHLIYVCEHLYKETTYYYHIRIGDDQVLMKYCDVWELIKQYDAEFNWEVFVERVKETKMENPVFYVFYYIGELYGVSSLITTITSKITPDDLSYLHQFRATGNISEVYNSECYQWRSEFKERLWGDRYAEARSIIESRNRQYGLMKCRHTSVPLKPQVDKQLDSEWSQFESTKISEMNVAKWQPFSTHVQIGKTPESDSDLCFYVKNCWDQKNFYLSVTVIDDNIVTLESETLGYFHDQDAVRLYFDVGHSKPVKELIFVLDPSSDNQVICLEQTISPSNFRSQKCKDVSSIARIYENSYTIEACIPFKVLEVVPETGVEFGFDIEVSDCDETNHGVKTILVWSGGENRNEFDRSVYGKVVLVT